MCDTTVRTGLSTRVVYSLIEMSKVNVSFSASTVNERKAQVGFRILEDEKTLEVTVFDYAPVDFFMEIYDFFKDDPQALMWDAKFSIFSVWLRKNEIYSHYFMDCMSWGMQSRM